MDVNNPEILVRGMYGDPDRPMITEDNDVDAPFAVSAGGAIPQDLQNLIQQASVDPEPEETESPTGPIDVQKFAEENPNSRYRLTNVAILNPGVCIVCKGAGGDGRQFVEWGETQDWYGVIYLCTFCIGEIADLLGYGLKSDWVLAERNLQEEISRGDDRWIEAREQLRAARLLLSNCHCGSSDPDSSNASSVPMDESDPEGTDSESNDSDESGSVEGFADVSESSVDDNSEFDESVTKPKRRRSNSSAGRSADGLSSSE
ncbi:hypothetical protein GCM10018783_73610 [Streptomyces griseosporeus]|nr:hypothetical protein GCM10018783_73610 [Streptomyces griseosporeus]